MTELVRKFWSLFESSNNNKALSKENKDLTDKVKDLENKNNFLSKQVKAVTDELKEIYQTLCIPFKNTIKERLNCFKSWINDFLYGDDNEIENLKQKLYDRTAEKELEQAMGFISPKESEAQNKRLLKFGK